MVVWLQWSFGYNSNISAGYKAANQSNIFSHAKNLLYDLDAKRVKSQDRGLIFIAHSLGGTVLKDTLRRSEVDPNPALGKIYSSTIGVFFFGTPLRGSKDWASFGDGVAKVASCLLGMDTNSKILRALLPSSAELELCRESFIAQWAKRGNGLTVRTFQESKGVTELKFGGFNKLVWHSLFSSDKSD